MDVKQRFRQHCSRRIVLEGSRASPAWFVNSLYRFTFFKNVKPNQNLQNMFYNKSHNNTTWHNFEIKAEIAKFRKYHYWTLLNSLPREATKVTRWDEHVGPPRLHAGHQGGGFRSHAATLCVCTPRFSRQTKAPSVDPPAAAASGWVLPEQRGASDMEPKISSPEHAHLDKNIR